MISYEAPTYFKNKWINYDNNSYNNPHINKNKLSNALNLSQINTIFDKKRANSLEKFDYKSFDIYDCIKNEKLQIERPNRKLDQLVFEKNIFKKLHTKTLEKYKSFGRSKGLFTDFVERNNQMNVFGPLIEGDVKRRNYKKNNSISEYNKSTQTQKVHTTTLPNFKNSNIKKRINNSIGETHTNYRSITKTLENTKKSKPKYIFQNVHTKTNRYIIKFLLERVRNESIHKQQNKYVSIQPFNIFEEKSNPIDDFEKRYLL